ncbi:MAG: PEP/pyruvate-binding domain-containing protein [Acidobacteriota bacterium]|nr:PEP/pyruvate-binding domain-containing protein [Acidobacteriota bacterium]
MSTTGWWLEASEVTAEHRRRVGGKAWALARLAAVGGGPTEGGPTEGSATWNVPPWMVITTDAFRSVLAQAGVDQRIQRRLASVTDGPTGDDSISDDSTGEEETELAAAGAEIRGWIRALQLPPDLVRGLESWRRQRLAPDAALAVRSSAVGEDGVEHSFAGLHDSFLFRRSAESVAEAILQVWASAFNDRALAYRRSRGLGVEGIEVAVVVQEMIDAAVSGVLFTAHPTTGEVREMVLSALYGAGEGLVSAGLEADSWVLTKAGLLSQDELAIQPQIVTKDEQLVFDQRAGEGLRREPVAPELAGRPCLDEEQVRAAGRLGLAVERFFREPQDIELCFDRDGRLFLLQSRAVTTVEEVGPAAGNRKVWDNSNIIESYSGVTSPMTFSFIRRAYTIVYHCFAEVMGIASEAVRANRPVFENMLGLFRGQVYYNLLNWYRVVRLFPGYGLNKRFMESMMGVREELQDEEERRGLGSTLGEVFDVLRLVLRIGWRFTRIRSIVAAFEEHFRSCYGQWNAVDLDSLAPHQLHALYREMEERMLWQWKAPIVNDFYVMVFYGVLKRLCESWCADQDGSLQNDLLCGEGGIESTAPTRELMRMAREIRRDPEAVRTFLDLSPEELARRVPREPRFAELAAEIESYLEKYGFRGADELKLEEPSVAERPEFLYQVLKNYVAVRDPSVLDLEAAEERETGVRRAAEERAMKSLSGFRARLYRRWIFRRVLANARLGVKNRENLRFARTRIYGLFRQLLLALGEDFARRGLLEERDDIFYLALDEVWDYLQGTAVSTDLQGLAALRRRDFDDYREETERFPADRFETWGLPYDRNLYRSPPSARTEGDEGDGLRGTPCCPGVVRGPVKVIRDPAADARLDGEILVAGRTDPGWVPLFPAVSGLLIERGSILSHSAIVAREMGLPTIVGIPGLLERLETGDQVEMDGAQGTVRPLAEAGLAEAELSEADVSETN